MSPSDRPQVKRNAPRSPAILFEGVTKRFGDLEVLRGVDLEVAPGEVLTLIGPSGGGKSTLLRLVNGLEIRDGGRLRVLEEDVPLGPPAAHPTDPYWIPLRRRTGFVFQAFHLYPHLTALQNVSLALVQVAGASPAEARERAASLMARVGLADKVDARPAQLSGGQQQRVAIARALAMDPEVVLFDEPTSALDPEVTGEVLDVIQDLASAHESTLMIVTHEYAFAREAADRVASLEGGRIVEVGSPAQVFEHPTQERTRRFLRRVRR
ncbi:MAG: amino acid ABC transporter ATP-binding protein [Planctomycetota bacterium]|jgi:ABC-type polar amino acid transport system ATPase subunit